MVCQYALSLLDSPSHIGNCSRVLPHFLLQRHVTLYDQKSTYSHLAQMKCEP